MGELHLQIYIERMLREFGVETVVGPPQGIFFCRTISIFFFLVNYRETITMRQEFEYLHKKQTGGAGQYAKLIG